MVMRPPFLLIPRSFWAQLLVPPSGAVLYLPGLPGVGSTITDYSGQGNDGTIVGATWKTLGSGLPYLDFDADDDKVTITDATSIQNIFDSPGGTVLAWIRPDSDGQTSVGRIAQKGVDDRGWVFGVREEGGGYVKLRFDPWFDGVGGTGGYASWRMDDVIVPITQWSFVAVTYDSSHVDNNPIFYFNDTTPAFTEATAPLGTRVSDATKDLIIGSREDNTFEFDGGMSLWVFIKGEIWSASKVQNFRNQIRHLFGV